MSIGETHNILRETHRTGAETREWLVSYGNESILDRHGIEAAGWVEAREGYDIARPVSRLALLYVCLEGRGEVLEGGQWRSCEAGQAYLAPVGRPHAYRAIGGAAWKNCWVLGRNDALVGVAQPVRVSASGQALFHAIQGLYSEDTGAADALLIAGWVELILRYARRIGHPGERQSGRLAPLWERVAADLTAAWTMHTVAQEASLSEESVRRICLRETGLPPMEYITYLRMRSAASLLASQPYTISEIAQRVGYSSPFAFSTAFKRVLGVAPAHYRQQAIRASGNP